MPFNPHQLGIHKVLQHIPLCKLFDAPYASRLRRAVNIADLRLIAKARVHKMIFDYADGAAEDEITLRRAKDAYSQLEMHYKVLAGIKPPLDMSTKIFGHDVKLPFLVCPIAGNRIFHWEGELAVAKAAEEYGIAYSLSSLATTAPADISGVHNGLKIFQLYVWKDRQLVKDVLVNAKEAGFQACVLTADTPVPGNRERDCHNDFTIPPKYGIQQIVEALKKPAWTWDFLSHEPYTYACINTAAPAESITSFIKSRVSPEFDWKDAEWLLGEWNGPTALKGVIRPDDAKRAVDLGFSTVWVSNHGGRQLDTSPATIDVLPLIREAVGPDVEIVVDGGVQRGTDIAKALALGADAVGIGKPFLLGLAAGGNKGVMQAFDILKVELDRAMGLLGTATVADLKREGPSLIQRRQASARDYPDIYAHERGYGGGII